MHSSSCSLIYKLYYTFVRFNCTIALVRITDLSSLTNWINISNHCYYGKLSNTSHRKISFQSSKLYIICECMHTQFSVFDFRSQWSVNRYAVMSRVGAEAQRISLPRRSSGSGHCSCYKIIVITILLSTFDTILTAASAAERYRYLGIFPHPAVSHFRAFEPLLTELSARGHHVYVVSHFPTKTTPPSENYHDFPLDQSDIMTSTAPADEVSWFFSVNWIWPHVIWDFWMKVFWKCSTTSFNHVI